MYVSSDADFLGLRGHVEAFARAIRGTAVYPPKQGLSALHGAVKKSGTGGEIGVDVLHRIVGLDAAAGGFLYRAVQRAESALRGIDGRAADRAGKRFDVPAQAEKVRVRADVDAGAAGDADAEPGEPERERLAADQDRALRGAQQPQEIVLGERRLVPLSSNRS